MASIKNKLIAIYERIYASDCVMNEFTVGTTKIIS